MAGDLSDFFGGGGGNTVTTDSNSPSKAISGNYGAPINVSPVGVNFGAILQPYMESAYNGGMGLEIPSRYVSQLGASPSLMPSGSVFARAPVNVAMYVGIGLLAVGAAVFIWKGMR